MTSRKKPNHTIAHLQTVCLGLGLVAAAGTVIGLAAAVLRDARDAASPIQAQAEGQPTYARYTPRASSGPVVPDRHAAFERWSERVGAAVTREDVDDFLARNAARIRGMGDEEARRYAADRLVAEAAARRAVQADDLADVALAPEDRGLLDGSAVPPAVQPSNEPGFISVPIFEPGSVATGSVAIEASIHTALAATKKDRAAMEQTIRLLSEANGRLEAMRDRLRGAALEVPVPGASIPASSSPQPASWQGLERNPSHAGTAARNVTVRRTPARKQ